MDQTRLSKDEIEIKKHCNPLTDVEIEVREAVMSKLNRSDHRSMLFARKPMFAGVLVFCLLVVGGIGTYATGVWQIKGPKGEVVYEAESLDGNSYIVKREGANPLDQDPAVREEVARIQKETMEQMTPGQVLHVYIHDPKLNPKQTTAVYTKPMKIPDYDQFLIDLKKKSFPTFMMPTILPKGFHYQHGVVEYETDTYENMGRFEKEMKEEASQTGDKVILREGKYNEKDPAYASMTFNDGQDEVILRVKFTGAQKRFVSPDATVEKVSIQGKEGFYIQDQGLQSIEWVQDGSPKTIYNLEIKADSKLSKEDLLFIAENMK